MYVGRKYSMLIGRTRKSAMPENNVTLTPGQITTSTTTGQANVYGGYGSYNIYGNSQTNYHRSPDIVSGSHDQALLIKMFAADDPNGERAIDAQMRIVGALGQNRIMVRPSVP